ncbi:general secretion pathway protein GspK [Desulfoprunum benzoelyticum]|nr:general secretion pathway protein GspK [Desulfoprunum benzoelyticum]MBM9530768.1 general secretion pathway protein GspK [Desulfoprunum benzoelyticum]
MALLLTIIIISLLIVVTFEFARFMRQHHLAAANLKSGEQLGAIARSGVAIAAALLAEDGKGDSSDTFLDSWATLEQVDFSGLFDQGGLRLSVVDLSGKVQINSLIASGAIGAGTREILINLLISGDFTVEDEVEARGIVDSLVDWLDTDDLETEFGAESSYYQLLSPGYACQNGPVHFIEDLLLVKGITPALLYGDDGKKALQDFVTVYGDDGKINLNTAPPEVIRAINPQITVELAAGLDEFRRQKENQELLAEAAWYLNVPSWPGDVVIDTTLTTTASSYFSIVAEGKFDTMKRKVTTVLRRAQQGKITELNRRVE